MFLFIISICVQLALISAEPIVIAHRGASGYLPEHTLAAKAMAFLMKSDYIEQDVVLTKDSVPIVLHDIYLDEVTDVSIKFNSSRARADGRYYAIDFTLKEIKTLNATERLDSHKNIWVPRYKDRFPLWKAYFQISTLEEEIELIQGLEKSYGAIHTDLKRIGLYVELKRPRLHRLEQRGNFAEIVFQILKKYNYTGFNDPVIIQCFDPFELMRIRKDLKETYKLVQLLQADEEPNINNDFVNYTYWNSQQGLTNISTFANGIGPEKDQLIQVKADGVIEPSNLLTQAKRLNLFLHPYTFRVDRLPNYVKSYDELLQLFLTKLEIDGFFTDFPDVRLEKNAASAKVTSLFNVLPISLTALFVYLYEFKKLF